MSKKNFSQLEFGDFQTPEILAMQVTKTILNRFNNIKCVVDPTCGIGNFLKSIVLQLRNIAFIYGWEINSNYVTLSKKIWLLLVRISIFINKIFLILIGIS